MNMPASILNHNDISLMNDFFQNPNGTYMANEPDWLGNQTNVKVDNGGIGQLPEFDQSHQTLNEDSFTLGGHTEQQTHQSHLTHFHTQPQQHVPRTPYVNHSLNDLNSDQSSAEAFNAAVNLQNLQHMQVRHHSTPNTHSAQHMNGMVGGNWGGIEGGRQIAGGQGQGGDLRSPLTSSGRHSSNSFHDIQQQQVASPLRPGYHTEQGWAEVVHNHQYPNMAPNHPHAHQSRVPGNPMFPGQPVYRSYHPHTPQQQMQKPVGGFGSDPMFNRGPYQAPRDHIALEMERGNNLNNVPFAEQLAGQAHAHPMHREQFSRVIQSPQLATSFSHSPLSPAHRGGLPNTAPPTNNRNYSSSNMLANNAVSPNVSDEDVEVDHQPRKRGRKSRDAGDDEYNPNGGSKKTRSRRGSKIFKIETSQDDEILVDPTANGQTSKRRKMSSANRSSPGSQDYISPRGNGSETPEAEPRSSSKKKKGVDSLPRNNLSDEQKRQNHIHSEKVRRDLIKAQYDALDSLVPGLKSGKSGLSRADVLLEIVAFTEFMARGNEKAVEVLQTWTPSDAPPGSGNG